MYTFKKEDRTISSAKKVLATLGSDIEKLIKTIVDHDICLIILPKHPIEIGIRLSKNHYPRISNRLGENPLNIELKKLDGFIPSTADNEKILRTLNWKTSEPYVVVYTNPQQNLIKEHSPYTLALKSVYHEGKCDHYCPCGIQEARLSYRYKEFYFIDIVSQKTSINLDEIFLLNLDIEKIKNHLHEELKPDFNDIGDYQVNPWSNQVIKDINAIHHHFQKNNMINNSTDKKIAEKRVQSWLEKRYSEKKLTGECLRQIPKIVTDYHSEAVNFEAVLEEEIKNLNTTEKTTHELPVKKAISEKRARNRKKATDLIVLIDIIAEKHYKGKQEIKETKKNKEEPKHPRFKSYISSSLIAEKLEDAGIEKDVLKQAIYSIIKHKFSEVDNS